MHDGMPFFYRKEKIVIRHIVLFRFKEGVPEPDRKELVQRLKDLKKKIPCIVEMEVGADVVGDTYSYHVGLNSLFRSREDLNLYRDHPDHLEVVKIIQTVCASTVKVDYEAAG